MKTSDIEIGGEYAAYSEPTASVARILDNAERVQVLETGIERRDRYSRRKTRSGVRVRYLDERHRSRWVDGEIKATVIAAGEVDLIGSRNILRPWAEHAEAKKGREAEVARANAEREARALRVKAAREWLESLGLKVADRYDREVENPHALLSRGLGDNITVTLDGIEALRDTFASVADPEARS